MGARYSNEAIQRCKELYLQFNGGQFERIETEMRKEWPGWSKSNLTDRGKGKNRKDGWVSLYGWKRALEIHIAVSAESTATSAELLFLEIENVRRLLNTEIRTKGTEATRKENKDLLYQHEHYCKLSIDALARLEAARNNLAGFAKFWEQLVLWLPSISAKASCELLKVSELIIERARLEYASSDSKD